MGSRRRRGAASAGPRRAGGTTEGGGGVRILVTVTFNPNQLRAHLAPLIAIPEVREIVLVADEQPPSLPKLRAVVPSARARRALGRAGAKLVLCACLARRLRPDWILSYSLTPHGLNGYLAGRLSGRPTMYHMIGGAEEWEGGGHASENSLLSWLPRPVPPLERALLRVVRGSTLVGTMGESGRQRLLREGLAPEQVIAVPPTVDTARFSPPPTGVLRPYAVVTAAALAPRKRLHDLLAVVARLRATRPDIRAAVAGEGPLRSELAAEAARLGVADAVDFLGRRIDIEAVYRSGRVFVLTSRYEGLSVALSEAMACGLPAVVTDVGDLRDLVREGRNGHLVDVGDQTAMVVRIGALLDDPERYRDASTAARADAVDHAAVERLAAVYRRALVFEAPRGCPGRSR